jgi:DNA-binding NarL/FixJ family response regulator
VRVRVALADSDEESRAELRTALDQDAHFEVCAEAADAPGAIHAATRKRPQLWLLACGLRGGALAACREIAACLPEAKIVLLTPAADPAELFRALRAGANGYLPSSVDKSRLPHILLDVIEGEAALPRALVGLLLEEFRDLTPLRRRIAADGPLAELTSREWQILDLMRRGLTTAEMARLLYLSQATIRSHIARVLHKLGLPNREAAIELFPQR